MPTQECWRIATHLRSLPTVGPVEDLVIKSREITHNVPTVSSGQQQTLRWETSRGGKEASIRADDLADVFADRCSSGCTENQVVVTGRGRVYDAEPRPLRWRCEHGPTDSVDEVDVAVDEVPVNSHAIVEQVALAVVHDVVQLHHVRRDAGQPIGILARPHDVHTLHCNTYFLA